HERVGLVTQTQVQCQPAAQPPGIADVEAFQELAPVLIFAVGLVKPGQAAQHEIGPVEAGEGAIEPEAAGYIVESRLIVLTPAKLHSASHCMAAVRPGPVVNDFLGRSLELP